MLRGDAFYAVRSAAADTLAKMATPEALTALIGGAEQSDARVRKEVVAALAAFPNAEAKDALWKMAAVEKNPEILASIIQTWGARPGEGEISAELKRQMEGDSYHNGVAMACISALRAQNDATAVPLILARLKRDPQNLRSQDLARAF